jgi:hypothetical protein
MAISAIFGDIRFNNKRPVHTTGIFGDIRFKLFIPPDGTINGRVKFSNTAWPHKTYGCHQIHVNKVNVAIIQRAIDVDKHKYFI